MQIRRAIDADWQAIWPFWQQIVAAGETYDWAPETDEATARSIWMREPPGATYVAELDGRVVGSYTLAPNRGGLGDHVANASYMVDPACQGQGIGRRLVRHSLEQARRDGYRAMQFNAVVETNEHAVRLYLEEGFEIIGTIPEGFRHAKRGFVGFHIMYRKL